MRFLRLNSHPRAAFTLIEMVISMALMAIILACSYACLASAMASQKLVDARGESLQSARVALALISADLRGACDLSKEIQFIGMQRLLGQVKAGNLDFATRHYTPSRQREFDFCEVSYFLEENKKTGRYTLFRRRDPTPDDKPLEGGSREEIAQGVLGIQFEYYDGFDWFDEWGDADGKAYKKSSALSKPNATGLPEAVRITLWMESERPGKSTSSRLESKNPAPPMVFQTVARLNLAATEAPDAGGNANANPAGPNANAAPGGPQ